MDCLDRTNVAQFVLGLHALELQLHALGISESPTLDIRSSMAIELMNLYEQMGNTLAKQVRFDSKTLRWPQVRQHMPLRELTVPDTHDKIE